MPRVTDNRYELFALARAVLRICVEDVVAHWYETVAFQTGFSKLQ